MPGTESPAARAPPPRARRVPHVLRAHGDERDDDWYWLRNRDDPDVIAYLETENAYADTMLAPLAEGPWEYTSRTEEGSQYAIHCRRPRGEGAAGARVVLDENSLAEGHDY